MAYTKAQWDAEQASFPVEDRMSYDEYLGYLKVEDPDAYRVATTTTTQRLNQDTPSTTIAIPIVDERSKIIAARADTLAQQASIIAAGNVLANYKAVEAATLTPTTSVSAVEGAAQARAAAAAQMKIDEENQAEIDFGSKILPSGLTQAQMDAIALTKTSAGLIGGTVDPATGYITSQYETPEQKAKRAAEVARIAAESAANADAAAKKLAAEKAAQAAAIAKAEAAAKAAAAKAALDATNAAAQSAAKAAADKAAAELAALLKQRTELEAREKRIAELRAKVARNEPLTNEERAFLELGPITASSATKKIKSTTYTGKGKDRKRVVLYDDETSETIDDPEALVTKKIRSTTYTGTGKDRKKVITYDDDTTEITADPETPVGKTVRFSAYQGSGKDRKKVITYTDDTVDIIDDPEVVTGGDDAAGDDAAGDDTAGDNTGTDTATGGFTQKDIDAAVAAALKASTETTAKNNMIQILTDRFAQYGLSGLTSKIRELAISGATEATITLGLMETDEYKKRFSANADRVKKGLAVLTPGEYLNIEDSYRQVLRAYGLKQFDTDEYVKQFISNDISPTELSNRVVTAVQRVQNADPAIINQLKQYYGIGATDMVGYVLDPEQSFQKIQRQIAASEIGVAAGRQGLTAGVSVAEQLAAQGVTEAEAQKGYATIADILPTAEKLSSIYGTTLDGYGQTEGEQEVFNSLASAQRKRQKLTAREIAAFSGSAGAAKTSLSTSRVGQF
jgi:hypothetical protein